MRELAGLEGLLPVAGSQKWDRAASLPLMPRAPVHHRRANVKPSLAARHRWTAVGALSMSWVSCVSMARTLPLVSSCSQQETFRALAWQPG